MERWETKIGEVTVTIESEGLKAFNYDGKEVEITILKTKDAEVKQMFSQEEAEEIISTCNFHATFTCRGKSYALSYPLINFERYQDVIVQRVVSLAVEMYLFLDNFPTFKDYLNDMGVSDKRFSKKLKNEYEDFSKISSGLREVLPKDFVESILCANELSK